MLMLVNMAFKVFSALQKKHAYNNGNPCHTLCNETADHFDQ